MRNWHSSWMFFGDSFFRGLWDPDKSSFDLWAYRRTTVQSLCIPGRTVVSWKLLEFFCVFLGRSDRSDRSEGLGCVFWWLLEGWLEGWLEHSWEYLPTLDSPATFRLTGDDTPLVKHGGVCFSWGFQYMCICTYVYIYIYIYNHVHSCTLLYIHKCPNID